MNESRSLRNRKRPGSILAAVLMTLLAVLWIGAELTRSAVLRHRAATQAEQRQQAFWLAESGAARARNALQDSSGYEGETWHVDAQVLGADQAGKVAITVESSAEASGARRVLVQAYYPEDAVHRTLCTREFTVQSTGD